MYGVIIDRFCYNIKDKEIIYFKNLTISVENLNYIYDVKFELSLDYGLTRNEYIPNLTKKFSNVGNESAAKLLHPIITVYREKKIIDIMHLDEEILTDFSSHFLYHDRIFRFLKSYLVIN